ncbi:unnamed protein product [Callosobruchus maculatus]|uniref:Uncharacterized protein n=1 Tax=Callosobruchus maculatus TaxID=64391 RepID=A0A653BPI7_CALMS|nr:unnamed protein product [Callosobruchus maculatus]
MVYKLSVALVLFSAFSCVLVDPQSPGFTFSFETENGVKRAYAYGTPDFHGTYFYYTNDGARHVVNFGGSERASGSFVALAASRPVGPPAKYPTTSPPTTSPPQTRPPTAYAYRPSIAQGGYEAGYAGGYAGESAGGGGGGGSQSIAPGLVASAIGGGLG